MIQHRWSGYPGAFCLDCFVEDQREYCVMVHNVLLECVYDHPLCEEGHPPKDCTEHINLDCLGKQPRPNLTMQGNCPGIVAKVKPSISKKT